MDKNWRFPSFDFLQVSFWWAPTQLDIIEFKNFLFQIKNQRLGKRLCEIFFY